MPQAGGSLRDVQLLAGHASITTTQRYIDGDTDAAGYPPQMSKIERFRADRPRSSALTGSRGLSGSSERLVDDRAQARQRVRRWRDEIRQTIDLAQEAALRLARRERRSTQRLFEQLRGRGYDGAHDSAHRFAKVIKLKVKA